ncbi:MAG: alpha/beta fold hydrolase [Candidatus Hodarchaeota archaeon]
MSNTLELIDTLPNVKANNIQIEYEMFGDPISPHLLLVMGMSEQMISWDEEFCKILVERGFHVIRFDNRDAGLSTKIDEAGVPDVMKAVNELMGGKPVESPYTLYDMADDAIGLLDALGIEKTHVCGLSMGAMIAQILAAKHPDRVLSLVSITGSSGNPALPLPKEEVTPLLFAPLPEEREPFIEESIKRWRALSGSKFEIDEDQLRKIAAMTYDRCMYPQGAVRQLIAILATGNRLDELATIKAPTIVIHGTEDPINSVQAGKEVAGAIPDAELMLVEGMGHTFLASMWSMIVDAIANNATRAQ